MFKSLLFKIIINELNSKKSLSYWIFVGCRGETFGKTSQAIVAILYWILVCEVLEGFKMLYPQRLRM